MRFVSYVIPIWPTLTCCFLLKFQKCNKLSTREGIIRKHASSSTANGFSIESYVRENILNQSAIKIKFVESAETENDAVINKGMTSRIRRSTVILTSISIRRIDDIQSDIRDIDKFIAKLQLSDQELSVDKFLYSHDIGGADVHKMTISRIPTSTYQKLDLARKIVDFIGSASIQGVDIYMLDMYNDHRFFDLAMCEALQAAFQMSQFALPNFKRDSSTTPSASASSSVNKSASKIAAASSSSSSSQSSSSNAVEPINLNFILQSSLSSSPQDSSMYNTNKYNNDDSNNNNNYNDDNDSGKKNEERNTSAIQTAESIYNTYLQSTAMINQGTNTARALSILPPNILYPASYTALIQQICQQYNNNNNSDGSDGSYQLEYTEWTPRELQALGCGAFLAVTQANGDIDERSDRLVRIKYTPSSSSSISSSTTTVSANGGKDTKKEYSFWRDEVDEAVTDAERVNDFQINDDSDNNVDSSSSSSFSYFSKINNNDSSRSLSSNSNSNNNNRNEMDSGNNLSFNRPTANQQQKQMLKPLVLVGKGVCYDTGGINLKTANSMKTMKHDMAGSATALGTFLTLIQTNYSRPVECWMAIVENNINQKAFRPDDVITSITGDTIEIVHSDAEGRMILADVLAIASRKIDIPSINSFTSESPALIIDFATLTGTCISSLSNRYIGAFSNRREFYEKLIICGENCGERSWPFPIDDDFQDDLLSDVADVLQCRQATEADHIYAAIFLKRFIHTIVPWIHLDMGSAHRSGGLGHVPSDYTGCGVRLATEIIKTLLPSI